MRAQTIKLMGSWRALLLLAVIPVLTNCSRIDGSVGLNDSSGAPYSFEGAKVEVFDLNPATILPGGTKIPKGIGDVETADGAISLQVITATIEDHALYSVEVRCPADNTSDACGVESPLHAVLSGAQLMAGGWKITALTEAIFHNIGYYAAVEYSVAEIQQMLDNHASALLLAKPSGMAIIYDNVLAWGATETETVKRPGMLNNISESLAEGISGSDLKLLARQWVNPVVATVNLPLDPATAHLHEIEVANGYAYIGGANTGLNIVDIGNPEQLARVGHLMRGYSMRRDIEVQENFVYALGWEGELQVFDVSNPLQPVFVAEIFLSYDTNDVAVAGDYVYVAEYNNLYVVNVSDPAMPTVQKRIPGGVHSVKVFGDTACIVEDAGARIFDISDPATPILISTLTDTVSACRISAEYAYVAGHDNPFRGLSVFDIRNPATPVLVGQLPLEYIDSIEVFGTQVYALHSNTIRVIDVGNPSAPVQTGTFDKPGGNLSMDMANGLAYLTNGDTTLSVVDLSLVSQQIVSSGSLALADRGQGYITAMGENYAYLQMTNPNGGFSILDLSDPVAPAFIKWYLPVPYLNSFTVAGTYTFLSGDYWGDLRVANNSNPAEPLLLDGSLRLGEFSERFVGLRNIVHSGDYVYVPWGQPSDGEGHSEQGCFNPEHEGIGGLFVVDVHEPLAPALAGHLCLPEQPEAVAVNGNHAYAALAGGLLQVVEISNPAQPTVTGSVNLSATANSVSVLGNYAWVTEGANGIEIIDISDPAAPAVVNSINTPGHASYVEVEGNYAYVADGISGLLIFDITNIAAPTLVASINTTTSALTVALIGDYLYAATNDGVEVFKALPAMP